MNDSVERHPTFATSPHISYTPSPPSAVDVPIPPATLMTEKAFRPHRTLPAYHHPPQGPGAPDLMMSNLGKTEFFNAGGKSTTDG